MRPRLLKIKGLQSFKKEQEVDFDRLGQRGLFGIFGPTGSGKSTILDGITLALFGSVERARHNTQGIINTDETEASVFFQFDLRINGRRDTYKIERKYKRKPDNRCECKLVRLFKVDGDNVEIIADKQSDANNKIVELLGLNKDDFVRSVVLPQNKFQEFLLMDKSKRALMLERIFCLEEFGEKLKTNVKNTLIYMDNQISSIEGSLKEVGDITLNEIKRIEEQLEAAKKDEEKLEVEFKDAGQLLNKTDDLFKKTKMILKIETRLKELNNNENEINQLRNKARLAKMADYLSENIKDYRQIKLNYKNTCSKLDDAQAQRDNLHKEFKKYKEEYEEIKIQKDTKTPELIQKKNTLEKVLEQETKLNQYIVELNKQKNSLKISEEKKKELMLMIDEKSAEYTEHKNNRLDLKKQIKEATVDMSYKNDILAARNIENDYFRELKEIEIQEKQYKRVLTELEQKENKKNQILQKISALNIKIQSLSDKTKQHESSKPADNQIILDEAALINNYNAIFEKLEYQYKQKDLCIKKVNEIIDLLKKDESKLSIKIKNLQQINNEQLGLEKVLREHQESLQNQSAGIIAESLKEGKPCPVCGSIHHPAPAHLLDNPIDKTRELIKNVEGKILRVREEKISCMTSKAKLEEKIQSTKNQKLENENKLKGIEEEEQKLRDDLPDILKDKELEGIRNKIEQKMQLTVKKQKKLKEWEEYKVVLQKSSEELKEDYSKLMYKKSGLDASIEGYLKSIKEKEYDLNEQKSKFKDIELSYNTAKMRYGIESFKEEYDWITKKELQVQKKNKLLEKIEIDVEKTEGSINKLKEKKNVLQNNIVEINSYIEYNSKQISNLKHQIDEVTCGENTKKLINYVQRTIDNINFQLDSKYNKKEECQDRLGKLEIDVNSLKTSAQNLKTRIEEASQTLNRKLKETEFDSIEAAESAVIDIKELDIITRRIEEYEQEYRELKSKKHTYEEITQGIRVNEEKYKEAKDNYKNKEYELNQARKLHNSLEHECKDKIKRYEKSKILNTKLKSLTSKQNLIRQIQQLIKGNAFVKYVAEERLRYITHEASEVLGDLTTFRYGVQLDSAGGFVIIDNNNGGVIRSVTTLSGGETFLTSLSLALALSKQIQLKGQSPLEFFFLDEGFGTLDQDLLNTVIDSLERLGTEERVIGLISHVQELKQRLPVNLQVKPADISGTGSSVSIVTI